MFRPLSTTFPVLVAVLLVATLSACGGSIQSSPLADEFNAALQRCQNVQSPRQSSCKRRVTTYYSRALTNAR